APAPVSTGAPALGALGVRAPRELPRCLRAKYSCSGHVILETRALPNAFGWISTGRPTWNPAAVMVWHATSGTEERDSRRPQHANLDLLQTIHGLQALEGEGGARLHRRHPTHRHVRTHLPRDGEQLPGGHVELVARVEVHLGGGVRPRLRGA